MVAKTFGQRPSAIARDLFPELRWLQPIDWYALDVAATARYWDMEYEAAKREAPREDGHRPPPMNRSTFIRETGGQGLEIRGTEIPPWRR